ncbi:DUF6894 family protein [Sphingosinicella rhizophila]|uniref:DUF6894 domain-containing protein n=1 Tax=Sphingosinicella rhizophila TaxID=3050082 RepID=A0ABU3QB74_9SPHN|nr:hypothetical protein [Sphingosinicella sp. GR2756]MDT9600409.1 hypothetical protein [Sphingosinicella sp. GR2756]
MPRYYFQLYECGNIISDAEGRELPDIATVRKRAIAEARQLMSAEVAAGRLCLSCRIEVEDEDRRPVLVIPFREALEITGL